MQLSGLDVHRDERSSLRRDSRTALAATTKWCQAANTAEMTDEIIGLDGVFGKEETKAGRHRPKHLSRPTHRKHLFSVKPVEMKT